MKKAFLSLLLALFSTCALAQGPVSVSNLPAATSVNSSDLLYIVQGGVSKKAPLSIPFTFGNTTTINPIIQNVDALDIFPPGSNTGKGINISQQNTTATIASNFDFNLISVANQTNATSGGNHIVDALQVLITSGGTSGGQSIGIVSNSFYSTNGSIIGDTVGLGGVCQITAVKSAAGGCYGAAFTATIGASGQLTDTVGEVAGAEADVIITTANTANWRMGFSAIGGLHQGAVLDAAFDVSALDSVGNWKTALLLNHNHGGAPLSTTGCVICTDGTAETITTGIDLSAYTISGNFLKSTGFMVDGTGQLTSTTTGTNLILGGNTTPQVLFAPSSGSTHQGNLSQQGDTFVISQAGVAARAIVDLNSGNFQLLTGVLDTKTGGSLTISTGVGSVKMSSANPATNAVWIPMKYNGTTYFVPGWTTNSP